jgi:hypothetical protein
MALPAKPRYFARYRQGSMLEVELNPEPSAGESRQTDIDQLAAGIIGVVAKTADLSSAGDDIMGEDPGGHARPSPISARCMTELAPSAPVTSASRRRAAMRKGSR